MEQILTYDILKQIETLYGSPVHIYAEKTLQRQVEKALNFPNAFGLTVRFALKACPNAAIIRLFSSWGVKFDCSSGYEVMRALLADVPATNLSLSSQELPPLRSTELPHGSVPPISSLVPVESFSTFEDFIEAGVHFNACSAHQLREFGKRFPGRSCGVRFNPGMGSGANGKTNVGGPAASFGIWHEQVDDIKSIAEQYSIRIERVHTHIGSGSDPAVWSRVVGLSLALVEHFPDVVTLNLGGGFKVARAPTEKSTDLQIIGPAVKSELEQFAIKSGRHLHMEIEPGTFLVAEAGSLLCRVQDIVSTRSVFDGTVSGYDFIKLNAGMNDVLRPSLYGAQHPILLHPAEERDSTAEYVIVGHCCESGDLFSCAPADPETLLPRLLPKAEIGDLVTIGFTGAYCSAMCTKNYNSFPESAEVMLDHDGNAHLIRRRQTLAQIVENEVMYCH